MDFLRVKSLDWTLHASKQLEVVSCFTPKITQHMIHKLYIIIVMHYKTVACMNVQQSSDIQSGSYMIRKICMIFEYFQQVNMP